MMDPRVDQLIDSYLDGELSSEDRREFEISLERYPALRTRFEQTMNLRSAMTELHKEAPESFSQNLANLLRQESVDQKRPRGVVLNFISRPKWMAAAALFLLTFAGIYAYQFFPAEDLHQKEEEKIFASNSNKDRSGGGLSYESFDAYGEVPREDFSLSGSVDVDEDKYQKPFSDEKEKGIFAPSLAKKERDDPVLGESVSSISAPLSLDEAERSSASVEAPLSKRVEAAKERDEMDSQEESMSSLYSTKAKPEAVPPQKEEAIVYEVIAGFILPSQQEQDLKTLARQLGARLEAVEFLEAGDGNKAKRLEFVYPYDRQDEVRRKLAQMKIRQISWKRLTMKNPPARVKVEVLVQ